MRTLLRQPRMLALLLASLLAMLLGLAGLIAAVVHSTRELSAADRLIVGDTAPSIVALETATVHLGALHSLLVEHPAREARRRDLLDRGALDEEIAAERAALAESIQVYLGLPVDPGEGGIIEEVRKASAGLDRALRRASGEQADSPAAMGAVDAAVNRLSRALLQAVTINVDLEENAVASLRSVRRAWLPGAVVFQALTLAAAVGVLGLALRIAAAGRHALEAKSSELEAFTGRVAHDLLSPLMGVGLALAAAEPCLAAPQHQRVRAMVARASASLQRVRVMVTDLLDFARAGAKPPPTAEADAYAVSRDVAEELALVAESAGAELRVDLATRRHVRCSAGALTSMLANLVQNAIKYLGGAETRVVTLRVVDDGIEVRFEVEDTGPGVDAEDRERIFEPYVRGHSDAPGLGLGLATVKRLAEAHHGHVGIDPGPRRGALFWVTLPAIA